MAWKFAGCPICGAPGAHAVKQCPAYRVNEKQEALSGMKIVAKAK